MDDGDEGVNIKTNKLGNSDIQSQSSEDEFGLKDDPDINKKVDESDENDDDDFFGSDEEDKDAVKTK